MKVNQYGEQNGRRSVLVVLRPIVLMAVGLLLTVSSGLAQSYESIINFTNRLDGNWGTATNWVSADYPPTYGTNTFTVVYSNNAPEVASTQNVANPFDLNQLIFAPSAQPVALFGSPLQFDFANTNWSCGVMPCVGTTNVINSNPQITQQSTNNMDIELGIILTTNITFVGSGSGMITVGGSISEGGPGSGYSVTLGGSGTIGGVYVLNLTNVNNAYIGGTVITRGAVAFAAGAVPASGTITVNQAGTVWFQDGSVNGNLDHTSQGGFAVGANQSLNFYAQNLPNMYLVAATNMTYAATYAPTNAWRFGALPGVTLTLTNVIPDLAAGATPLSVGVTLGTVRLTQPNTFSGGAQVILGANLYIDQDSELGNVTNGLVLSSGGTLETTNNFTLNTRTVTVGASGGGINPDTNTTLTITNAVLGAGTLTKGGLGTLVLAGTNLVGALSINTGLVQINSGIALSNTIVYLNVPNSGGTGLTNTSTDTAWAFGGLGGTNQLNLTNSAGAPITSLALGSTVGFTNIYYGTLYGLSSLTFNGNNVQVLNSNDTSSPETITVSGNGILLYGTTNEIGGSGANITVNSGAGFGVVGYPVDQTLLSRIAGGSGAILMDANTSSNLSFTAPAFANLSLGAYSPSTNWNYIGTSLTPGVGGYHLGGGGGQINISNVSVLTGNTGVWVGVNGNTGTVSIQNNQNYTGGTVVSNGVLATTIINGFGVGQVTLVGGQLILGGTTTTNRVNPVSNGTTITLNGGTWAGIFQNNNPVTLNMTITGSPVWTPAAVNATNSFAGTIVWQSSGNLRRNNFIAFTNTTWDLGTNGMMIQSRDAASDMYIGALKGDLTTSIRGTSTAGSGTATNTYWIGWNGSNTTFFGGILENTNYTATFNKHWVAITKMGSGTWTLAGTNNSYFGPTIISNGVLVLSGHLAASTGSTFWVLNDNSLIFSNDTVFGLGGLQSTGSVGGALSLANTDGTGIALTIGANNFSQTFTGNMSGAGSLTKIGSGVQTLSGSNTYSGGTFINGGVLAFGTNIAFPQNNNVGGGLSLANGSSVGLFFSNIQPAINALSPSTDGGIAISSNSANENVDFATAGITNAWLVAAQSFVYGGTYTPFVTAARRSYRLGANAGATLYYTNALVDVGGPTMLQIGAFGGNGPAAGGTVALLYTTNFIDTVNVITSTVYMAAQNNTYSGGTQVQGTFAAPSTLYIASSLSLGAPNTALTLSNAILRVTNNVIIPGTLVLQTNGTVNVDAIAELTVTNSITGVGPLTKTGSGTFAIGATNMASGGIVLNQGVLAYTTNTVVPAGGPITLNPPAAVAFLFNWVGTYDSELQNLIAGYQTNLGAYAVIGSTANQNVNFGVGGGAPGVQLLSLVAAEDVTYGGAYTPYNQNEGNGSAYNLGAFLGRTLTWNEPITNSHGPSWVTIGGSAGGYPGTVQLLGNGNNYSGNSGNANIGQLTVMGDVRVVVTNSSAFGATGTPSPIGSSSARNQGGIVFTNNGALTGGWTLQVSNNANVSLASHDVWLDGVGGTYTFQVDQGSTLTIPTRMTLSYTRAHPEHSQRPVPVCSGSRVPTRLVKTGAGSPFRCLAARCGQTRVSACLWAIRHFR